MLGYNPDTVLLSSRAEALGNQDATVRSKRPLVLIVDDEDSIQVSRLRAYLRLYRFDVVYVSTLPQLRNLLDSLELVCAGVRRVDYAIVDGLMDADEAEQSCRLLQRHEVEVFRWTGSVDTLVELKQSGWRAFHKENILGLVAELACAAGVDQTLVAP